MRSRPEPTGLPEPVFAVLGPVRARRVHSEADALTPRVAALLAVLVLRRGQLVRRDELIEALWGDEIPDHARNNLHVLVRRLRDALGAPDDREGWLSTGSDGYVLQAEPEHVDVEEFERLADAAVLSRRRGHLPRALHEVRAALALWRGTPFGGLDSPGLTLDAQRLEERRLDVLEQRIELDLLDGRGARAAAELTLLVARHPYRECFHQQLMQALAISGRRAEALAHYRTLSSRFATELGIGPSERTRALERSILAGRSVAELASPGTVPSCLRARCRPLRTRAPNA